MGDNGQNSEVESMNQWGDAKETSIIPYTQVHPLGMREETST